LSEAVSTPRQCNTITSKIHPVLKKREWRKHKNWATMQGLVCSQLFKFPFADEDFKIDGKLHQHYDKLYSPPVCHILTGADKNDHNMKKLLGRNLRSIGRTQLGKVAHQMWHAYESKL
jgi:hypothetical protein